MQTIDTTSLALRQSSTARKTPPGKSRSRWPDDSDAMVRRGFDLSYNLPILVHSALVRAIRTLTCFTAFDETKFCLNWLFSGIPAFISETPRIEPIAPREESCCSVSNTRFEAFECISDTLSHSPVPVDPTFQWDQAKSRGMHPLPHYTFWHC